MGLRGPDPDNKLSVIDPRPKERPKPFSSMSGGAKSVWKRIVGDLPADFFHQHELDTLRAYCEAAAMNAEAIAVRLKRLPDDAEADDRMALMAEKANAFKEWKETSAVLASLGTKLRLNKNSKITNKQASKIETGQKKSTREGLMFGG